MPQTKGRRKPASKKRKQPEPQPGPSFPCLFDSDHTPGAQAAGEGAQWVARVLACTASKGEGLSSARSLIGSPTHEPWKPAKQGRKTESVELEFEFPVFVERVEIHALQGGECVVGVHGRDLNCDWQCLWSSRAHKGGGDSAQQAMEDAGASVTSLPLHGAMRTNALRLDVDLTKHVAPLITGVRLFGGSESAARGFFVDREWSRAEGPRPIDLMATLPNGVCVDHSTLTARLKRDTGLGLFAKWPFNKGDYITEYDGSALHAKRCEAHNQAKASISSTSHHRRIECTDWVISGLRTPLRGRGGGSFANDPCNVDKSLVNARIITCRRVRMKLVSPESMKTSGESGIRQRKSAEEEQFLPVVALQALRDIAPGEEIFVDYKPATRKRLRIQNYTSMDYLYMTKKVGQYRKPVGPAPLTPEGTDKHSEDGQWVESVPAFSSEFFSLKFRNNDHTQLVGPPKVYPKYGDWPGAWAPQARNGEEFLELKFPTAVFPTGVEVYETLNPGAVVSVSVKHHSAEVWHVLMLDEPELNLHACSRIFAPPLGVVAHQCDMVRLDFDTSNNFGWSQVDAVKLRGSLWFGGPAYSPSLPTDTLACMSRGELVTAFLALSPVPPPLPCDLSDAELRERLAPRPEPPKSVIAKCEQALAKVRAEFKHERKQKLKSEKKKQAAKRAKRPPKKPISPFACFSRHYWAKRRSQPSASQPQPPAAAGVVPGDGSQGDAASNAHDNDGADNSNGSAVAASSFARRSIEVAQLWAEMGPEQRAPFEAEAARDRKRYDKEMALFKRGKFRRPDDPHEDSDVGTDSNSDAGVEGGVVDCVCGAKTGKGFVGAWVACDDCDRWFHSKCVGFKGTSGNAFQCPKCTRPAAADAATRRVSRGRAQPGLLQSLQQRQSHPALADQRHAPVSAVPSAVRAVGSGAQEGDANPAPSAAEEEGKATVGAGQGGSSEIAEEGKQYALPTPLANADTPAQPSLGAQPQSDPDLPVGVSAGPDGAELEDLAAPAAANGQQAPALDAAGGEDREGGVAAISESVGNGCDSASTERSSPVVSSLVDGEGKGQQWEEEVGLGAPCDPVPPA